MESWESIQNSINYIENNISEELNIDTLAQAACLSPFYFQRLFSRLVGHTVMEYVKLRRLAKASEALTANTDTRIIDIACQYGFESHEAFSRVFKSTYGLTPNEFRKNPIRLTHCFTPDLSLKYTLVDENVPLVADGIVLEVKRTSLEAARIFAGHSIQNPMGDIQGPDLMDDLWNRIHSEKSSVSGLIETGQEVGVSLPGEIPDCFTYFAGVEVDSGNDLDQSFSTWSLEKGQYVVCTFEAENFFELTSQALNKARDYMFCMWLPKHKLNCEPFMAEVYYETTEDASKMEIWIKLA